MQRGRDCVQIVVKQVRVGIESPIGPLDAELLRLPLPCRPSIFNPSRVEADSASPSCCSERDRAVSPNDPLLSPTSPQRCGALARRRHLPETPRRLSIRRNPSDWTPSRVWRYRVEKPQPGTMSAE